MIYLEPQQRPSANTIALYLKLTSAFVPLPKVTIATHPVSNSADNAISSSIPDRETQNGVITTIANPAFDPAVPAAASHDSAPSDKTKKLKKEHHHVYEFRCVVS